MMKKTILFSAVAILFAATGVFVGTSHFSPASADSAAVASFFSQRLENAQGQAQEMQQWKDKTLVLNFWATWCPPCVDEMPELSSLQEELEPAGVQILGIGIDSPSNIAEFSAKYNISYPLFAAGMSGTDLSRQFGNQAGGLPFTVLLGRDGEVKKTYIGRLKMEELRKDLHAL